MKSLDGKQLTISSLNLYQVRIYHADIPNKQRTVDEDALSEESSNVALPQDIETENSVASCSDSSPQYIEGAWVVQ